MLFSKFFLDYLLPTRVLHWPSASQHHLCRVASAILLSLLWKRNSLATQSVESFLGLLYRCLPSSALSPASQTSYHNGQTTKEWPLTLICEAARFHASKKLAEGTPRVMQWLRLHTPNTRSPGSIPPHGTRFHMLQLGVHMTQKRFLYFSTKLHSQINKILKNKK